MGVFVLTIEESEKQLVAGVPESITLSSNIPSMIFFTVDGTDPDFSSTVATGAISLPRSGAIILKAFGYSPLNVPAYTALLTRTYSSKRDVDKMYRIGREGISIDRAEDYDEDGYYGIDGYIIGRGADGYAIGSDGPLSDYDIRFSDSDYLGVPPGTVPQIEYFAAEDTASIEDDDRFFRETLNDNPYFNPKAMVIDIDNTKPTEVTVINDPWKSTRDIDKVWGGRTRYSPEAQLVTGGFVRAFYNPNNKIYQAYYFDHVDARWIMSKNLLDLKVPKLPITRRNSQYVFKWIFNKRHILK